MDLQKMIAELREERKQLIDAMDAIERLARTSVKRRGRPPAWLTVAEKATNRRGRPPGSKNKGKGE